MYAHTCDHCGLVLEAEGSEVQTEDWMRAYEGVRQARGGHNPSKWRREKEHKGEQTDLICCWCRVKMAETKIQVFRFNKIT